MKAHLLLCLLLLPLLGFGQPAKPAGCVVYPGGSSLALVLASTSDKGTEAVRLADRDIAAGHRFLLLPNGLASIIYPGDQAFCREFNLTCWHVGCTGPDRANMQAYNGRMFDHLTTQYGRRWLAKVRKDAVGLQEWQRRHRE